jgi:mitotic spindle assembly checkpoint protein MAD2
MSQLDKWMVGGKISKLVVVITSKDTGENLERWQFDVTLVSSPHSSISDRLQVQIFNKSSKSKSSKKAVDKENAVPEYATVIHIFLFYPRTTRSIILIITDQGC